MTTIFDSRSTVEDKVSFIVEMSVAAMIVGGSLWLLKISAKYLIITALICWGLSYYTGDVEKVFPFPIFVGVIAFFWGMKVLMFFVGMYQGARAEYHANMPEEIEEDLSGPTNVVNYKDGRKTWEEDGETYMKGFGQTWILRGDKFVSLRNA